MADDTLTELQWEERKLQLCQPPTLVGASAIIRAASTSTAFLVHGRIPAGAVTFILGIPGAAKSWLAYDLALAVINSDEWLGFAPGNAMPAPGAGRALILNYDNPTAELGRRMIRLGLKASDPVFFHSPATEPLRLPKADRDLLAIAAHVKPHIVIVDSFRKCHDADENSSRDMSAVTDGLKSIAALGAAVVVVHHAAKSTEAAGLAKARGSGEITASADAVIVVADNTATWEKTRSWPMADVDASVPFTLRDVGERTLVEAA